MFVTLPHPTTMQLTVRVCTIDGTCCQPPPEKRRHACGWSQLSTYSGYDFDWCHIVTPLSNVSCFIFRFLPTTQTSTKKINYRLIHRINVHSKHALCVNAHIQTIANSLLAGKESSLKNLKVEPVSFTSCPVHVFFNWLQ